MRLAMKNQRIDGAADVIDTAVARDLDLPGVGINFDLAGGAAVRKHRLVHLVLGRDREAVLQFGRQGEALDFAREFQKVEGAIAGWRGKPSVGEVHVVGSGVKRNGGY